MMNSPPAHATQYSGHMVFIILENNPLSDVTESSAPYMHTSLASVYSNSTNYVGSRSSSDEPSLSNYLVLLSGQNWGCTGSDANPNSGGCTSGPWNCANPCNLVDLLTSKNISWKAYMEGMPGSDCNGGKTDNSATHYSVHHDPFEYFSNIVNTPSRCSLVVPAGSYTGATSCSTNTPSTVASTLISDLGNPSTSHLFAWLTPNNLYNAHDCCAPSTSSLSQPNNWLSVLVPLILNTATFTSDPTATIVVTFDEPSTGTYGSNPLYFVVAGPGAKRAYSSSIKYTHCNTL